MSKAEHKDRRVDLTTDQAGVFKDLFGAIRAAEERMQLALKAAGISGQVVSGDLDGENPHFMVR